MIGHKRKHPRLKGYDYGNNATYFVTFCVKNNQRLLGAFVGRDALGAPMLVLSTQGQIIHDEIKATEAFYDGKVSIDNFIVMPNHVHMLISIQGNHGAPRASRPTIPGIIGIIKRKTNEIYGFKMWQDSFYDHIIRNSLDYQTHWHYINENPNKWELDKHYTEE
jgi:REP element-mobilizing transposase RayT